MYIDFKALTKQERYEFIKYCMSWYDLDNFEEHAEYKYKENLSKDE